MMASTSTTTNRAILQRMQSCENQMREIETRQRRIDRNAFFYCGVAAVTLACLFGGPLTNAIRGIIMRNPIANHSVPYMQQINETLSSLNSSVESISRRIFTYFGVDEYA